MFRFPILLAALSGSFPALAADVARLPAYTPPPASAVSAGSLFQVILSLLLVLGAVLAVAWLLKRLNLPQQGPANVLKVISGVAVGQRERVVLIEVNDTWLVIGVAPGQVRTLHTLPKQTLTAAEAQALNSEAEGNRFRQWLKEIMEKRNAG